MNQRKRVALIYALTNFRNYPEQTPLFNVIQKLTRISEKTVELSGRQLRHNLDENKNVTIARGRPSR